VRCGKIESETTETVALLRHEMKYQRDCAQAAISRQQDVIEFQNDTHTHTHTHTHTGASGASRRCNAQRPARHHTSNATDTAGPKRSQPLQRPRLDEVSRAWSANVGRRRDASYNVRVNSGPTPPTHEWWRQGTAASRFTSTSPCECREGVAASSPPWVTNPLARSHWQPAHLSARRRRPVVTLRFHTSSRTAWKPMRAKGLGLTKGKGPAERQNTTNQESTPSTTPVKQPRSTGEPRQRAKHNGDGEHLAAGAVAATTVRSDCGWRQGCGADSPWSSLTVTFGNLD